MTEYLDILNELPARHSGVLFEQLHIASISAAFNLRALGLTLPSHAEVPTQAEVYEHLVSLTNFALQSYLEVQQKAPTTTKPNEIWGEEEDDLFWVEVTGLSGDPGDGFSVKVQFNLLYR